MERLIIHFSPQQLEWLRAEAARLGISVAEVVRRIIDKERKV